MKVEENEGSCPGQVQIAAAICTRNRPDGIAAAVRSVLANRCPGFTLLVVDQSEDEATAESLAPFLTDSRLRYVRVSCRGLSRARNVAMEHAATLGAEYLAFTDDDCLVAADWLVRIRAVFAAHPRVAVVFCNVYGVAHDRRQGFIPEYRRRRDLLATRVFHKRHALGIGAGMAVRLSAMAALGGFDEMLGAGTRFTMCDDGDIATRALLAGFHVYETTATAITHDGFRTHHAGHASVRANWIGIGAAYAKPLRAGRWQFAPVVACDLFALMIWPILVNIVTLRRRPGFARLVYFVVGMGQGWKTPIDRKTLRFVSTEEPAGALLLAGSGVVGEVGKRHEQQRKAACAES